MTTKVKNILYSKSGRDKTGWQVWKSLIMVKTHSSKQIPKCVCVCVGVGGQDFNPDRSPKLPVTIDRLPYKAWKHWPQSRSRSWLSNHWGVRLACKRASCGGSQLLCSHSVPASSVGYQCSKLFCLSQRELYPLTRFTFLCISWKPLRAGADYKLLNKWIHCVIS